MTRTHEEKLRATRDWHRRQRPRPGVCKDCGEQLRRPAKRCGFCAEELALRKLEEASAA